MKCPACGAILKKISGKCSECGAALKKNVDGSLADASAIEPTRQPVATVRAKQPRTRRQSPSLIEFPGINRSALPEWRKELSERVRERQERRTREVVLESAICATATLETEAVAAPVLELLPPAEQPPLNPLVEAALKRIERANAPTFSGSNGAAAATAVAYQESVPVSETERQIGDAEVDGQASESARHAPKSHNLAVVPNRTQIEEPAETRKPKRLIGDANDPALNYLDTVPTTVIVERRDYPAAPAGYRLLAGLIDLAIMLALSTPLLALTGLTQLDWEHPRVLTFSASAFLLVGFLYLTLVTAFAGRTLGMRLCALRIVDARNGLIPTGRQSAARSFFYLLSLASAGIALLYLFLDSENYTIHDRFTRTSVVRA